jgi:hypothetical protein
MIQDIRFGLRTFVKHPGVAAIAILSLALATGATAAIFSIVNSVPLRPLPFGEPDRLVQMIDRSMTRDDLESLRVQSHAFASLAEYAPGVRHLHMRSSVERVTAVVSDRDLFEVLAARPLAGRTFRGDDQRAAVISETLWRARFGADPNAIGQQIRLDDRSFTVIGVMPDAFQFPYGAASILRSALTERAVALVLVAACANVANLLLALTGSRMDEIATRAALGASRARLARQFIVESLLLALAGGLAAMVVARWTTHLLVTFGTQRIPRVHEVSFDWAVFGFLLCVSVAAAMFFGVVPALAATRVDAGLARKGASRSTAGRRYSRVRDALVIAEVTLAFVLASCAALVIGEMQRLRARTGN